MGQQPAQVGVPTPSTSAPHPSGSRPPQQVLNLQMYFPGMAGKKTAVGPKIQMLRPLPSQLSAAKSFVHKELPAKDHSQKKRSKLREGLVAALSVNSSCHQFGLQSAGNASESPLGSAGGNKVVSGNSSASALLHDNILQHHGPSESMSQPNPKRARLSYVYAGFKPLLPEIAVATDETTEEKKARIHKAQRLAFTIEKRLFESFGGVSNQYQLKGIALLHKLKDRNNLVLRERVLSGDLTADCLCAMTIDELDSKELSEWRMARAEERPSMVVLPDREEEDVTRLVRNTHKGESQVEVEETDVMEVGLVGGSLSNAQAESVDKKSVHKDVKESDDSVPDGVAEKPCSSNTSSNLEYPANEKNDLMQEPMIDDVELTENLPQIMTLLEFMHVLHSEPHSEDQSAGALLDDPSIDKADKALMSESFPIAKDKAAGLKFQFHSDLRSPQEDFESKLELPINKSVPIMDPGLEPKNDVMAKESDNSLQDDVAETCNSNTSSNLKHPTNEKNDLMQEPIIDDVELTENLPQIMTLLEFMKVLHSEPHSGDLSAGALQDYPSIDKADKALKSESFPIAKDTGAALKFQLHYDLRSPQDNSESKLKSPVNKSVSIMDPVLEPKGDVIVKSPHEKVDADKPDTINGSIPESTMQCKITSDTALPRDIIWDGTIQVRGFTSPANIVAIFKSGEKPSTNKWRRFLEINKKVRLSVFKNYLKGLAISRSRAIMVTEICSKEGSLDSVRHHPLQIIVSHIADGRGVGLVKAAEGVNIYLCPQGEATKILADHLPKEHSGSLTVTETSIIGLILWQRPHVSNVPLKRQDVPKNRATISSSVVPRISQPPSRFSKACCSHEDAVTADGLPGFGPGVVKDDADLPEYNCGSVSNSASSATTSPTNRSQWYISLSDSKIRKMVLKYGPQEELYD